MRFPFSLILSFFFSPLWFSLLFDDVLFYVSVIGRSISFMKLILSLFVAKSIVLEPLPMLVP